MTSEQTLPPTNEPRVIFGMGERLSLVLLLLAVLLAYGNTLVNDFTLDDNLYISNNRMVTDFSFPAIFHAMDYDNIFRPLTFGSLALNWFLGGHRPFLFHLFSLTLHGVVTVLLYLVLRRLLEQYPRAAAISWVAALLFAVHPIHTEAVDGAFNCSELLAMALLLVAWWLHMSDAPVLTLVCFVLALLAKESAVAFVPLVVIGDHVRGNRRPLLRYGSVAAVGLLYLAVLRKAQGGHFGERGMVNLLDNPLAHLPVGLRIANALRIAWKYVGLHVYPASLSCDYSYNAILLYSKWRHLALPVIAVTLVLAVWIWTLGSGRKAWFLAGAIYLCGFAATSNILLSTGTIFAERLAYLPSAGFCLLVALAWTYAEGTQYRKVAWVVLTMVVVGFGVRTVIRNRDWHDNYVLFFSAVKAVPGSAKMHENLAVEYYYRREIEEASAELTKALKIYPDLPDAIGLKGLIASHRGDDQEAARLLREALSNTLRENPNHEFIAVNLAAVEMKMGNNGEALKLLDEEVSLWPRSSRAYSNRGVIFYQQGDFGRARADAETALKLEPRNPQAQALMALLAAPPTAGSATAR